MILEVARQTVHNWIKGSKISNEGICKIIEVGGYEALAYILGTKPFVSNAKDTRAPDKTLMHGKGARFWYHQYVLEKAKTILNLKQDYAKLPDHARDAIHAADAYARIQASSVRGAGSKNPRPRKQLYE
ncbi:MAG: helix-turn-helix domain-containing protein [Planctomycetota bacterium]|nr:helix-turn-helix domain-containing protein [Planctomycetota bacterium]